jgi:hypothetical protein
MEEWPITLNKAKKIISEFERSGLERVVVNRSRHYEILDATLFTGRLQLARDVTRAKVDISVEGQDVVITRKAKR